MSKVFGHREAASLRRGVLTEREGVASGSSSTWRHGVTRWMDAPLLILSGSILGLAALAGPFVSTQDAVVAMAIGAVALRSGSIHAHTAEATNERRCALFLVVLLNVYLISLTENVDLLSAYGWRLMDLADALALGIFVLGAIRSIRLRRVRFVRTSVDRAVFVLFLLTCASFLGLHVLLSLNGLPAVRTDLLEVVFVAAVVYFVLGDVLETDAALARALRLALIPLAVAALRGASLPIAVLPMSMMPPSGVESPPAPKREG